MTADVMEFSCSTMYRAAFSYVNFEVSWLESENGDVYKICKYLLRLEMAGALWRIACSGLF